jgi:hypothetical protein
LSNLTHSELVNPLKTALKHYALKSRHYKVLKRVYNDLNENASKLFKENEDLKTKICFFEQNNALSEKINDDHENALQEFIRNGIKRSKLASMIYHVSRNKGEGIGYSKQWNKPIQSSDKGKSCSEIHLTFVKEGSEDRNVSGAEVASEPQVEKSEALSSSDALNSSGSKTSEPEVQVTSVSMNPKP